MKTSGFFLTVETKSITSIIETWLATKIYGVFGLVINFLFLEGNKPMKNKIKSDHNTPIE